MTEKIYSGIGSRDTPAPILLQMEQLAVLASEQGWILRSGGAVGADSAFEAGCDKVSGQKEIYIPFKLFNNHHSSLYPPSELAHMTAKYVHPNYTALSRVARLLIGRNMHQILGWNMSLPVRCVVCYTKDGCESFKTYSRGTGGTGSAIALASYLSIPVFNLYHKDRYDAAVKFLMDPDECEIIQL
jgi:hypothetical protein